MNISLLIDCCRIFEFFWKVFASWFGCQGLKILLFLFKQTLFLKRFQSNQHDANCNDQVNLVFNVNLSFWRRLIDLFEKGCALFQQSIKLLNKASVDVPFTLTRPHRGLSLIHTKCYKLKNLIELGVLELRATINPVKINDHYLLDFLKFIFFKVGNVLYRSERIDTHFGRIRSILEVKRTFVISQ